MFDPAQTASKTQIKAMADTLVHRGPDDEGLYVSGQVGLGFRRLSIIDLKGGHQPLSNEDGTVWIVFNGEIYNYLTLRNDLAAKGHVFKSQSDTEVIVHLYEEYGVDCVSRLRGMFALAVWDSRGKTLILARDRVGIKPLYYYLGGSFFSFSSEIKALVTDPELERQINLSAIDRFLAYQYLPGTQTPLRNVFKLEPGHTLVVKNGTCQIHRYWDLDFSESHPVDSNALADQLQALLDETVQLHMISDVPVGFLLSGGIDSTAMLSIAADKADRPISTFTIGFSSDTVVDERPFARIAAARYGSTHYETSISSDQFATFLPTYVWYMEEPVCEPPAVALYYVSQLARQHVKVLISGEGGDEAFAGYENYRNLFWFERLKHLLGPARKPLGFGMERVGDLLHSRVLSKYGPRLRTPFEQYYRSRTSSPFELFSRDRSSLYSDEMLRVVDEDESVSITREYLARSANYNILNKMLYVDTHTWLPDDLLVKADKMTMANSVELRVPFLDHKVLEFAATLPRNQKIQGWTMKYLLKKALKGRVPNEIVHRKKAGFPVPYESWLQTTLHSWVRDVLLDSRTISRGYFRKSALEALVEHNRRYGKYAKEAFSLVVLELWHRAFADLDSNNFTARPAGVCVSD